MPVMWPLCKPLLHEQAAPLSHIVVLAPAAGCQDLLLASCSRWEAGCALHASACSDVGAASPPCRPTCAAVSAAAVPAASHVLCKPKPAAVPSDHAAVQVDTVTTFYCSAAAGIVGALLTWLFLPDTTGLDLAEIDRYHRFMLAGQVGRGMGRGKGTGLPPHLMGPSCRRMTATAASSWGAGATTRCAHRMGWWVGGGAGKGAPPLRWAWQD